MDARDRRARLTRLLWGGQPSVWRLGVPVVLVLAGLLFAASAVTSRGASLRPSDTRDLADVVAAQDQSLQAKEARVAALNAEVTRLTRDQEGRGGRSLQSAAEAARRVEGPAAMLPVRGSGLQVTLTDSSRTIEQVGDDFTPDDLVIHQQDVQAVVNALWHGGAEAMMIQDQRVISTSAVRCVGNTLILQHRVYSPPFTIKVIGDPDELRRSLDRDESVRLIQDYVAAVGLGFDVRAMPDTTFPAYDGSVTLQHATVAK